MANQFESDHDVMSTSSINSEELKNRILFHEIATESSRFANPFWGTSKHVQCPPVNFIGPFVVKRKLAIFPVRLWVRCFYTCIDYVQAIVQSTCIDYVEITQFISMFGLLQSTHINRTGSTCALLDVCGTQLYIRRRIYDSLEANNFCTTVFQLPEEVSKRRHFQSHK